MDIFKPDYSSLEIYKKQALEGETYNAIAHGYFADLEMYRMKIEIHYNFYKINKDKSLEILNIYLSKFVKKIIDLPQNEFTVWFDKYISYFFYKTTLREYLFSKDLKNTKEQKTAISYAESFGVDLNIETQEGFEIIDCNKFKERLFLEIQLTPEKLYDLILTDSIFYDYFEYFNEVKNSEGGNLHGSRHSRGLVATSLNIAEYYRAEAGHFLIQENIVDNLLKINKCIAHLQKMLFFISFVIDGQDVIGFSKFLQIVQKEKFQHKIIEEAKRQGKKGGQAKNDYYRIARKLTIDAIKKHPELNNTKIADIVFQDMTIMKHDGKLKQKTPIPSHDTIRRKWVPEFKKEMGI